MLKQLLIKNIAIIDSLNIEFQQGLTVITGESGSGKSILLDAIALAFGAKASPKEVLRAGSERGQVELLFDVAALSEPDAFRCFLDQQGLPLPLDETEILLSREFTKSGSRCRVNGLAVTREIMEQFRPWVIDLHGQHELTSLFQRDQQALYLDAFGGSRISVLKRNLADAYEAWHALKRKWETGLKNRDELERQRDFMVFQLQELTEAHLNGEDEDVEARQELEILSHSEKLIRAAAQSSALLAEGDAQTPAILDQLSKLQKKMAEGAGYDPALEAILQKLQGIHAELQEVSADLSRYQGRIEVNPERMSELSDRLDLLEKLKRKYGGALSKVIATRDELTQTLADLETGEQTFEALEAEIATRFEALSVQCAQLSEARLAAAEELKHRLLQQLQVLAMPGVSFDVSLIPIAPSRNGGEEIEFLFSANPGEPLRPLAKVASGGELSRFLLAMKVLTAGSDGLLTLVFDEIDTGISGSTAKAVAEKLASLASHLQVLAITHQPMIAAMGQVHFHVEKQVLKSAVGEEDSVHVQVHRLEEDEPRRLQVLARLVSGMDEPDEAAKKFIHRLREQACLFYQQASTASRVG